MTAISFVVQDDVTGSPHQIARSHTSMYVNEVGHNMRLVENVCSLESPRSVSYYIYIDRHMEKGETVELLVNYGDHYEGKCHGFHFFMIDHSPFPFNFSNFIIGSS